MGRCFSMALVLLCAACSGNSMPSAQLHRPPPYPPPVPVIPDVIEKNERGTVMRLSITAPPISMNAHRVQSLIDRERRSHVEVVQVLVYRRGAEPGKDVPIERWD